MTRKGLTLICHLSHIISLRTSTQSLKTNKQKLTTINSQPNQRTLMYNPTLTHRPPDPSPDSHQLQILTYLPSLPPTPFHVPRRSCTTVVRQECTTCTLLLSYTLRRNQSSLSLQEQTLVNNTGRPPEVSSLYILQINVKTSPTPPSPTCFVFS